MKPLDASQITKFLARFDDFRESEIRSLEIISPTEIEITLTAQDSARAFDWITVTLLFSGVSDARVVDTKKLAYVDMESGVTLLNEDAHYAFCVGEYSSIAALQDAQLYIISQNIKYNEGAF
jgi:hypothetical protein